MTDHNSSTPPPSEKPAPSPARTDSEPAKVAAPSVLSQLFGGVRGTILILIGALVGVLLLFPSLPMRIKVLLDPPQSELFVDSPEIYTRERLINDRLQEGLWLKDQLDAIRDNKSFVRVLDTRRTDLSVTVAPEGSPADKDADTSAAAPPPPPAPTTTGTPESEGSDGGKIYLTFDQLFELNNYYRSLVRQKILENSLDDRHDLLGNSLYILKFDTTMMSVPAAGQRGRVTVRIVPPPPFDQQDFTQSGYPDLLTTLDDETIQRSVTDSFAKWIESTEYLLNALMAERFNRLVRDGDQDLLGELQDFLALYRQGPPAPPGAAVATRPAPPPLAGDADDRIRQIVETYPALTGMFFARKVLGENYRTSEDSIGVPDIGLDTRSFSLTVPGINDIVDFILRVDGGRSRLSPPTIDVREKKIIGYVVHESCMEGLFPNDVANFIGLVPVGGPDAYVPTHGIGNGHVLMTTTWPVDGALQKWILDTVAEDTAHHVPAVYQKTSYAAGIRFRIEYQPQEQGAADETQGPTPASLMKKCLEAHGDDAIHDVTIGTGLVNYIEQIKQFSTYGYAVLPRESPIAIMRDIATVNRFIQSSGPAGLSGLTAQRRRGVDLRQVLTTFGDLQLIDQANPQSRGDQWEPVVGWIMDPGAGAVDSAALDFVATTESVLAIVSVPAWWTELNLEVAMEHLGRWGDDPVYQETQDYKVQLPYRADSIDTLLIADTRRGPVITSAECTAVEATPKREGDSEAASAPPSVHIMIRGRHLWRNTVVTLGGVKASAIEVLPNMKGILARFPGVGADQKEMSGILRVWTSEGVAEPPIRRRVIVRPGGEPCSLEIDNQSSAQIDWSMLPGAGIPLALSETGERTLPAHIGQPVVPNL